MVYDIEEGIFYIFTDGSSRPVFNEKLKRKTGRHGGKGIRFIYFDEKLKPIEEDKSDYLSYTGATNQDMELWACVDALKIAIDKDLSKFIKIVIVTDSQFVCMNVNNAKFGNRDRSKWNTKDGDPIIHKKKRKELVKYIKDIYSKQQRNVYFDWTPGHSNDKNNDKADKSAVKGAQSKIRIIGNNSEVRKKFFKKTIWFKKGFIPIHGQEVLIHIYSSRYLRKSRFRYNYEVVSRNNDFTRNAGWIYYDKSTLSAEFIYMIKIKDDGSNQIENIISIHTKEEIRKKMTEDGIDKDIFY